MSQLSRNGGHCLGVLVEAKKAVTLAECVYQRNGVLIPVDPRTQLTLVAAIGMSPIRIKDFRLDSRVYSFSKGDPRPPNLALLLTVSSVENIDFPINAPPLASLSLPKDDFFVTTVRFSRPPFPDYDYPVTFKITIAETSTPQIRAKFEQNPSIDLNSYLYSEWKHYRMRGGCKTDVRREACFAVIQSREFPWLTPGSTGSPLYRRRGTGAPQLFGILGGAQYKVDDNGCGMRLEFVGTADHWDWIKSSN